MEWCDCGSCATHEQPRRSRSSTSYAMHYRLDDGPLCACSIDPSRTQCSHLSVTYAMTSAKIDELMREPTPIAVVCAIVCREYVGSAKSMISYRLPHRLCDIACDCQSLACVVSNCACPLCMECISSTFFLRCLWGCAIME